MATPVFHRWQMGRVRGIPVQIVRIERDVPKWPLYLRDPTVFPTVVWVCPMTEEPDDDGEELRCPFQLWGWEWYVEEASPGFSFDPSILAKEWSPLW